MLQPQWFQDQQWAKHWAGEWSFFSSICLGYQYTKMLNDTLGISLDVSLFMSKEGYTTCSLEKEDLARFGTALANKVIKDETIVDIWCTDLKKATDTVLTLTKNLKEKEVTEERFLQFLDAFYAYGSPHRAVKIVVDFLPPDVLERLLPKLSDARVYAEPSYAETEGYMQHIAQKISEKTGYAPELILATTLEELKEYFKSSTLPIIQELEARHKRSVILFEKGTYVLLTEDDAEAFEKTIIEKQASATSIKGTKAYPGKITGKVQIILDAKEDVDFKEGTILVTGMTRPEYLSIIKKASAFITDAGGMLSHAAITARELKKPCIVGTEIATKVLKDGDLIEVDADNGVITILDS